MNMEQSSPLTAYQRDFSQVTKIQHLHSKLIVQLQKNPYPSHGRSLEIPRGNQGGAKQKTFKGGSMDIFWNCTLIITITKFSNLIGYQQT